MDSERYSVEDLTELYHGRWGIEELYKISKVLIDVEDFHAKTGPAGERAGESVQRVEARKRRCSTATTILSRHGAVRLGGMGGLIRVL